MLTAQPRTPPWIAAVGGPPRSGCTTLVVAAIRDAGMEPVWIATGAVAGVDLPSAATSAVAVSGKRKIIVIDELDALVASDPTTTTAIGHVVKKGVVPVVLIGHGFPKEWRTKAGDLVPKDALLVDMPGSFSDHKHPAIKGLAGAMAALRGTQEPSVVKAFRGDGIASGAVFDNFWKHTDLDGAVAIADAYSGHDAIQNNMARAGTHDDMYAALPIATAATRCRPDKVAVAIGTFGSAWSKTNAMYAKRAALRATHRMRVERLGFAASTLAPAEGYDTVRSVIKTCTSAGKYDEAAAVARNVGLDPPSLLAVMRLWPGGYTLATHGKIKKLLS